MFGFTWECDAIDNTPRDMVANGIFLYPLCSDKKFSTEECFWSDKKNRTEKDILFATIK